ncbi:ABC transporter ATP-binding protein [Rhodococcus sp. HNM0569]|uniref:ABC transporter ATP-binding protein n=1 Tax=Rhodococcus sp. HNM0569 TaxID=2716340 RepID=UPI00146BDB64|nr:ABC transporter ATP-binding protein [Rhodococcus sp. HNM0569]NLU84406.1 ABC transporter ATP-binding protein [Rhodococcus sp. HNM0569]
MTESCTETPHGGARVPPRVSVAAVHKSFGTGNSARRVLDGIDVECRAGEFVAVVGPSGCGKSTLLSLIAGLDTPDDGAVSVDGHPATAGGAAYMPQRDLLFPWRTILDNAALALEVRGSSRRDAREQARALFPVFGLEGFESARPGQLSGGMRQRAALLRTVVQNRPVLLLDEPFGALDSLTRSEMHAWLQSVWQRHNWTTVMITHDVREALFLADRVVVLSARPARVQRVVTVDLGRPRTLDVLTDPRFADLERSLLGELHGATLSPPRATRIE